MWRITIQITVNCLETENTVVLKDWLVKMSAKGNSKKMSKQAALGNFGFTKIVTKKIGIAKLCDISAVQEVEKKKRVNIVI